jgi:hypothetical protein
MEAFNLRRSEEQEPEEELDPLTPLAGIHPPAFSSYDDEAEWLRECQHAVNRQGVPWAVSPRCFVRSPRTNVVFAPGAEVLPKDFTIGQLLILERRGCVLRATEAGKRVAACPPDARFVVAPNQSITCNDGLLLAGAEVKPDLLEGGEPTVYDLVRRGVVVDRNIPSAEPVAEQAALNLRKLELSRAEAGVSVARDGLAKKDDASSQRAYIDAKSALDLATVRVEIAKTALEAAKIAKIAEHRALRERLLADLESKIEAQTSEAKRFRANEISAAFKLVAALKASHAYQDASYQLRVERNALVAELSGLEAHFEYPPGGGKLHQQIAQLGRILDADLSEAK